MKDQPRVGIFQANWPLQVHIINAIKVLLDRGYNVDVFISGVMQHVESLSNIMNVAGTNLRVFDLSEYDQKASQNINSNEKQPGLQDTLIKKIRDYLHLNDLVSLFSPVLFEQTRALMGKVVYKCLIGVEEYGLIWAGKISQETKVPLVYWSLELYTNDYPLFQGSKRFKIRKRLEHRYHPIAQATIIQDPERARVLLADNGVNQMKLLFVPVSLLGPPETRKADYLHRMLHIPSGKKVILAFGGVNSRRLIHELVACAQDFPEEWILVIHGPGDRDVNYLNELQLLNTQNRAMISTELVLPSDIGELVASADIGLAFYSNSTMNEYLTGKSSEKMALYARAGVPMVAFAYPSFQDVFKAYGCGRCVSDFQELQGQIREIFIDYPKYRDGAFRAYSEIYEFSKHFSQVVDWVDAL